MQNNTDLSPTSGGATITQSERRYRRLFEAARDGILILDRDSGQILEVNPFLIELLGYSHEEYVGKMLWEIGPFRDTALNQARWETLRAQGYIRYDDLPLETRDGRRVAVEFVSNVYQEGQKSVVQCNIRDITDRKKLRDDLATSANVIRHIATMAQRLQSCKTDEEIADTVARFVPLILPGVPGALCVVNNSRNLVRIMATWNSPAGLEADFAPADCWALRRGRIHVVRDGDQDVICAHVNRSKVAQYSCRPLAAQEETLGILYLELAPSVAGALGERATVDQNLDIVTENISLALANRRLHEKLRDLAIRDPLTSLFNRRYLEEALELELARSRRSGSPISLIMSDVDLFKQFNDRSGHDAGDFVLTSIAETMRTVIRKGDLACRYGGEEFVVMLPGANRIQARERANVLRETIGSLAMTFRDQSLGPVTISCGVAVFPTDADTSEALITAADTALYAAKKSGRNRVELALSVNPDPSIAQPAADATINEPKLASRTDNRGP